jgi:hypothetical protein
VRKPNIAKAFVQKKYLTVPGSRKEVLSKERPTDITNMTLRVVCRNHCNNGWMSRLEEKTKPFLLPLINGTHSVLDKYRQEMIATWIAMKLLTCEFSDPDDLMFTGLDRSIFMGSRLPPRNMKIWIARYNGEGWDNTYARQAATLGWAPRGTKPPLPPSGSLAKNTQEQTFVVGQLFVHSTATTVPRLNADIPPVLVPVMRQIWPYQSLSLWPFARGLTDAEIMLIATNFQRFAGMLPFVPGPQS